MAVHGIWPGILKTSFQFEKHLYARPDGLFIYHNGIIVLFCILPVWHIRCYSERHITHLLKTKFTIIEGESIMKDTLRKAAIVIACTSLIVAGATSCFAGTAPASLKAWGTPTVITQLGKGAQQLFYKVDSSVGYRYFIVKDGEVVADGMGKPPVENRPITRTGIHSAASEAYYAIHQTTVDDIVARWGQPCQAIKLANGAEELFFHTGQTELGDMVFMVRDGKVIAGSAGAAPIENAPVPYTGLAFNDLSTAYYTAHPTTVDSIMKTWGTPSQVRKLNNGMEELLFHVDNLVGDVCFLIKDGKVIAGGTGM
jgi:hypothetical protein